MNKRTVLIYTSRLNWSSLVIVNVLELQWVPTELKDGKNRFDHLVGFRLQISEH